jgi:hypothetical protein
MMFPAFIQNAARAGRYRRPFLPFANVTGG